jgi:hypothetical protein
VDIENHTRLVPGLVPIEDRDGRERWVLVLKGTFDIVRLSKARIAEEQEPIALEDRFHGARYASSLRAEDDLAPFKPRADVVIDAIARAPGDKPSTSWPVSVEVGALAKRLRVTGPRAWVRTLLGYELGAPQSCTEVPIRYERAYGGVFTDARGVAHACEANPVGTGFVPPGERASKEVVIAPQIESPDDPIGNIYRPHRPEGLGPLTRSWSPRAERVGTTDERWRKERAPRPPIDFDHAFYNSAHPDLVYPGYLKGDERVVLEGLEPHRLELWLPGLRPVVTISSEHDALSPALDTLFIDVSARRLSLTWRCTLLAEGEITALTIR